MPATTPPSVSCIAPDEPTYPTSVAAVATAIPAFIGCTEFALNGSQSLLGVPTRLTCLADYTRHFGGAPIASASFEYTPAAAPATAPTVARVENLNFFFHSSLRLFFANGGATCYVVSVARFADVAAHGGMQNLGFGEHCASALAALVKVAEVTLIVVPDAVNTDVATWQHICQQVLAHCVATQSRIAIFDVWNGHRARTNDADDVISGANGFRAQISGIANQLSYAAAYYPWLNTNLIDAAAVNFGWLDAPSQAKLIADLRAHAHARGGSHGAALTSCIDAMSSATSASDIELTHLALSAASPLYRQVMRDILALANVLPPSAALAGVYARIDASSGVFRAPANVAIESVLTPTVAITAAEQQDLQESLDGKSINAIRAFPDRGTLVWGARTLDGNSADWRYINVRRTVLMFEQSIQLTLRAFVFEPNDAQTWVVIKSVLTDFLVEQWKAGALAGSKPQDAISVEVGLGSNMTGDDLLDGYLSVVVKVALARPGEFIILAFQQQMQTT